MAAMNFKRGAVVWYGEREWRVVSCDPEVNQVRISRTVWDRAAGAERTLYATPAPAMLHEVLPHGRDPKKEWPHV